MIIYLGDKVQIKNNALDVTNGRYITNNKPYVEGSDAWATVDSITEHWKTNNQYGLPDEITKITLVNDSGLVVWQGMPEDISGNIIRNKNSVIMPYSSEDAINYTDPSYPDNLYSSSPSISNDLINPQPVITKVIVPDPFGVQSAIYYEDRGTGAVRKLNNQESSNIGKINATIDDSIKVMKQTTAWQDPSKRAMMLNDKMDEIQNVHGFPSKIQDSHGVFASKYDYRIIPGDQRYSVSRSLEDQLMRTRAALGIQVHGNNNFARAVKYYMYNRYKTIDNNLVFNKAFTHVFFTRPDLYILEPHNPGQPTAQVINHSESSMIWRRNPELFKLLVDADRCDDNNNFNMLLSNQITNFDITDETISTVKAGMSWNEYEMAYGDAYTGRAAGEFSCNFVDTSDLSIINLMKLWVTYIDNVSRGEWSPSYHLNESGSESSSHVYSRTLDYAASAYVFKVAPDGETVLYWSKYFGVFPINTGANVLSWNTESPAGDPPKLSIRFAYSFKKDLSPVTLTEFNSQIRRTENGFISVQSFDPQLGHCTRPFVGAPFIEISLPHEHSMKSGSVNTSRANAIVKLKFLPPTSQDPSDNVLFRSYLGDRAFFYNNGSIKYV